MAPWIRNQRLYDHLKAMGLEVTPVPFKDDPTKISWIQVSAFQICDTFEELVDRMLPADRDGMLPRNVSSPIQGTHVADVVEPAATQRNNVIDLPPVT